MKQLFSANFSVTIRCTILVMTAANLVSRTSLERLESKKCCFAKPTLDYNIRIYVSFSQGYLK